MLYPADHPYHWPTIGYMEDLTAASYEDVVEFFRSYYAPNNASLVVAGDIDIRRRPARWPRNGSATSKRGEPVPPVTAPPAIRRRHARRS